MKKIILVMAMVLVSAYPENCLVKKEDVFTLIKDCTGRTTDNNTTSEMYHLATRAKFEDGRFYIGNLTFKFDDGTEIKTHTDDTGIFEVDLKPNIKFFTKGDNNTTSTYSYKVSKYSDGRLVLRYVNPETGRLRTYKEDSIEFNESNLLYKLMPDKDKLFTPTETKYRIYTNQSFTVQAVFKREKSGDSWIVSNRDGGEDWQMFFHSSRKNLAFAVHTTDGQWHVVDFPNIPINETNVWHIVTATVGDNTITLYADNKKVASETFKGTISTSSKFMEIGKWGNNYYFNGYIERIMVIDKRISEAEATSKK